MFGFLIFTTVFYQVLTLKTDISLVGKFLSFEPVREKTNNLGFRPALTQTRLHSHTIKLEA